MTYGIDDKIGRSDSRDKIRTTAITVTTTPSLVPPAPLGRRNYIKALNPDGANNIAIVSSASMTYDDGMPVLANGGVWEDSNDGSVYAVAEGTTVSGVRVYERAERK
jgi:hypothetical protein